MTYSKWLTGLSVALAIIFAFLYFSGCGKKQAIIEDYKWQNKYDSLQRIKQLLDSSLEDASKDAKVYQGKADSLQKVINDFEPKIIINYADVPKRDSIINSLSVIQLGNKIAERYNKR